MVAAMAKYLIELELEIEDSRRSPADTRARALKAGRSIAAWAARLRHARVLWAQLEAPHGRIYRLIEEEARPDAPTP